MSVAAHSSQPSSAALNLQRVVVYRNLMVAAQLVAVLVAAAMNFILPLTPILTVIAMFIALNFVT